MHSRFKEIKKNCITKLPRGFFLMPSILWKKVNKTRQGMQSIIDNIPDAKTSPRLTSTF